MLDNYFPILIYSLIVFGLGASFIFAAWFFGPRRSSKLKYTTYECGVVPLDKERKTFYIKFYLIATFFILFDIETVFLIPWAIIFQEVNLFVVIEVVVFLFVLLVGLIYVIRKGVFDFYRLGEKR